MHLKSKLTAAGQQEAFELVFRQRNGSRSEVANKGGNRKTRAALSVLSSYFGIEPSMP